MKIVNLSCKSRFVIADGVSKVPSILHSKKNGSSKIQINEYLL